MSYGPLWAWPVGPGPVEVMGPALIVVGPGQQSGEGRGHLAGMMLCEPRPPLRDLGAVGDTLCVFPAEGSALGVVCRPSNVKGVKA